MTAIVPAGDHSMSDLGISERQVQEFIMAHPETLKLGALEVSDYEKSYEGGIARADIILIDKKSRNKYIVETMLGEIDPSHIIRVIEYWDKEQKRDVRNKCFPVLIAETVVESRFFNVAGILSRFTQLHLFSMRPVKTGDSAAIVFSPISIPSKLSPETDDEVAKMPATRKDWTDDCPAAVIELMDSIFESLLKKDKRFGLRYLQQYVTVDKDAAKWGCVVFLPGRKYLDVHVYIDRLGEVDDLLTSDEIQGEYQEANGRYVIRLFPERLQGKATVNVLMDLVIPALPE